MQSFFNNNVLVTRKLTKLQYIGIITLSQKLFTVQLLFVFMAPNQRLALIIMWSVLLVGVGRLWLFTSLSTSPDPEEIATNIQGELEQPTEEQPQETHTLPQQENNSTNKTWSANMPNANKLPSPFPLTILLPPRVQQEKINELLSRIDPENIFQPTLLQPTTLSSYLRAISAMSTGARQADIILLPRQEVSTIEQRWAQIDRSATSAPTGLFHPQVGKLLTASKSMFTPHALDPRVTVTQAPTNNLNLGTFLQTHRSPLQFLDKQSLTDPLLLVLSDIWLQQLYWAKNISLLPKLFLATPDAPCTMNVSCLQSWATALWLPLSALTNSSVEQKKLSIFPSLQADLPTTVRWWSVRWNDSRAFVQQRLVRIQKYLAVMSADQLPYESPLLPAYFPRLQRIVLQDEWSWIQSSLYRLTLLQDSFKQLQQRFDRLPISSLLDWSYRSELYLEKRQEIRKEK